MNRVNPAAPVVGVEALEWRMLLSGGLDPSFGSGGKLLMAGFPGAAAVAVQADGKILVASTIPNPAGHGDTDFLITRLNADGSLDHTFGSEGSGDTATDLGGNETAAAVAVTPDGKIVVAGSSNSDFAVVRYTSDGHLDSTFNATGPIPGSAVTDFGANENGRAVVVQSDEKIVVAGSSSLLPSVAPTLALVRYNADGTVDTGFGVGGEEKQSVGGFGAINALALGPGGTIVAGGVSAGGLSSDFVVARYTAAGLPDATFGTAGTVIGKGGTHTGGFDSVASVAVTADGSVLAAGNATDSAALLKYDSTGHLDSTFGTGGELTTKLGASATEVVGFTGVVSGPEGQIFAVGNTTTAGDSSPHDFIAARFTGTGALDPGFGTGGIVQTDINTSNDLSRAIAVTSDLRVVAAGSADGQLAVTRYLNSGLANSGGDATAPGQQSSTPPVPPAPVPSAELTTAARIRAAGAKFYSFNVTYRNGGTDGELSKQMVTVSNTAGYTGVAELVSLSHRRHSTRVVATYRLRAPQGRWSASDNGIYAITTLDAQPRVAAAAGAPADSRGGVIGTFTVKISSVASASRR